MQVPAIADSEPATVSAHVRVLMVDGRNEGLLDRAGVDPADQVEDRPGLVVRAASPGTPEGLLPDNGSGRLVVDVEVPSRIPQRVRGPGDGRAIGGDDGAGERVGCDIGSLGDDGVELAVRVHV